MDSSIKKIVEIITDIQERMATKEDLLGVRSELKGEIDSVRSELKEDIFNIRNELKSQIFDNTKVIEQLSEQMEGVVGYAKEIDSVVSRVSRIEKHVGIK